MADEDLIFRLEGVDGRQTSRAGHDGDSDADSDDEEGYFICPITDDPRTHQNGNSKVNNYCGNLVKSEQCSFSASPGSSFSFKVSGPPAPSAPAQVAPAGMGSRGHRVGSLLCFQMGQRCKFWA